jgi:Tat protein secretion system quality control protein TatD with DNase activity
VAVVGTRVADIKNIDPHEMARITTENACIAFPLLTS